VKGYLEEESFRMKAKIPVHWFWRTNRAGGTNV
jgi:hypothetical protein